MRLGTVALIVALALSVLSTPAPAQVASGPLRIDVKAVLGEPTTVGDRTVFLFNGTAVLRSVLAEGESDVGGSATVQNEDLPKVPGQPLGSGTIGLDAKLSGGPLTQVTKMFCTGHVDDAGTGSGRCAISGELTGEGAWSGQIDVDARSLTLTMFSHVVCPRCASR
jgi:hypothetical protein